MLLPLICLALAIGSAVSADDLIREHGKYSGAYQSDWATLPTGRELARRDLEGIEFEQVAGEDARQTFVDQEQVVLSGARLKVHWAKPECDKYKHTLYFFRNCKFVRIEDMLVIQADPDWRASSTFFFESCDRVELRNCYLAGTCGRAFIRIEGSREYFVDRVEIAGVDYGGEHAGFRCGAGIFVNNGAGWDEAKKQPGAIHAPAPANLEWGVIQNSYFHDYELTDPIFNHDAILFHAPADGIVFNCYFSNWEADSALDDSHRRNDAAYHNHLHRIERNVFERCHRVKTDGARGSPSCTIIWANNLYLDSHLADYHLGWPNWHLHETFVYRNHRPAYFLVMHCREGPTLFRNCLLHAPRTVRYMYETMGDTPNQDISMIQPDHFLYFMPPPVNWLHARSANSVEIETWEQWRAAGHDPGSTMMDAAPGFVGAPGTDADGTVTDAEPGFAAAAGHDFRLLADSPAAGAGSAEVLTAAGLRPAITRDFFGCPRPNPPSCGAFEVAVD